MTSIKITYSISYLIIILIAFNFPFMTSQLHIGAVSVWVENIKCMYLQFFSSSSCKLALNNKYFFREINSSILHYFGQHKSSHIIFPETISSHLLQSLACSADWNQICKSQIAKRRLKTLDVQFEHVDSLFLVHFWSLCIWPHSLGNWFIVSIWLKITVSTYQYCTKFYRS